MCVPMVAAIAIASIVATVAGTVYSVSAQQQAASKNAAAMRSAAEANARAAQEIAEMNALTELRVARSNAEALASTAAAEAQIAEANATRLDATAVATVAAGQAEEDRARTRSRFLLADQRARYGAAGVVLEGSPLEVLAFSAGQEELDALTLRFNAGVRADDLRAQGASTRLEASLGVQDAALRGRNLLSDAILKGETGVASARLSGQAATGNAITAGQAGIANARASATGTLISGAGQVLGSSSAQTLAARFG